MEIIYVDSLFLLNFIINYLLLLVSARLCSIVLRRRRYLLSAGLGAAYAVLCFVPGGAWLSSGAAKLALWGLMSVAAYGCEKRLLRCAVTFFLVSSAFGGAVWAASMLSGGPASAGGMLRVDLRVLVLAFALCYAGLTLALSGRWRRTGREIVPAAVTLRGKTAEFSALRDTGNTLRDAVTGRSVLVAGAETLAALFTPAELAALRQKDGAQALLGLDAIAGAPRFRPVAYSAVGVDSGLLPAFLPDALTLGGAAAESYIVAVSPTAVCGEGYDAVI